jgi:hypothetical protein
MLKGSSAIIYLSISLLFIFPGNLFVLSEILSKQAFFY